MTTKKQLVSLPMAVIAGAAMLFAGSVAADEYVRNADGDVWRNASGDCWTSTNWTEADAIEECHPDLVQREEPPAPPPERRTETRAVTLEAGALFGFDSAELTGQGQRELDRLGREIDEGAEVEAIRVTGHTDRIGSVEYNEGLSERRAQSVVQYLRGMDAFRGMDISGRGMGPHAPVVQCEDMPRDELIACLQPNRRVEVEIVTSREVVIENDAEVQN